MAPEIKWTRFPRLGVRTESNYPKLGDCFTIKRGIVTGANGYFILKEDEIEKRKLPKSQFKPILPSPRYIQQEEIQADSYGNPIIPTRLFVLDCKLSIKAVQENYPNLYQYLQKGINLGIPLRYMCNRRKKWYSQENRAEGLFYCNYMGRMSKKDRRPFRFLLNYSKTIVTNSFLILYPKPNIANLLKIQPGIAREILAALNCIDINELLCEGRVYGGGLYKLEPKELCNLNAAFLKKITG